MKTCFKCLLVKQLSEFYKHPRMPDGHVNKCKECNKKDVATNYRDKRDQYAVYERKRFQDPIRKAKIAGYNQTRRKNNKIKTVANYLTSNAIRDNRLIREPCKICGETKVEAHHTDYYKPLDVQWLCRKHHLEQHGKVAYT